MSGAKALLLGARWGLFINASLYLLAGTEQSVPFSGYLFGAWLVLLILMKISESEERESNNKKQDINKIIREDTKRTNKYTDEFGLIEYEDEDKNQ